MESTTNSSNGVEQNITISGFPYSSGSCTYYVIAALAHRTHHSLHMDTQICLPSRGSASSGVSCSFPHVKAGMCSVAPTISYQIFYVEPWILYTGRDWKPPTHIPSPQYIWGCAIRVMVSLRCACVLSHSNNSNS